MDRNDNHLSAFMTNSCTFNEFPCLEPLLETQTIEFLLMPPPTKKYLTPPERFFIYKSEIKTKMAYLQLHSYRRNVTSLLLFYLYSHGKCSDEPHSFVSLVSSFTHEIRYGRIIHILFVFHW